MRRERRNLTPLKKLISIVAGWAEGEAEIVRVHLFGSRVRGRTKHGRVLRPGFRFGSDLDVAVELVDDPEREALNGPMVLIPRWRPKLQACLPVRLQLEMLDPNDETSHVTKGVVECSRLIYERIRAA
jgi:predicted nucleotidyltransferase